MPEIKVTEAQPTQTIAVPTNPNPSLSVSTQPVSTASNLQGNQGGTLQGTSPAIQPAVGVSAPQPTLQGGSTAGVLQPSAGQQSIDLSGKYGRDPVSGLITNKQTLQEFHNPDEFFADSGYKTFDNLKFDEAYKKPTSTSSSVNQYQSDLYNQLKTYTPEQLNDVGLVRQAAQDVSKAAQTAGTGATTTSSLIPSGVSASDSASLQSLVDQLNKYTSTIFDPTTTGKSLVDSYNALRTSSGLDALNTQLVDLENIMNGSQDDIKAELMKSGALVTGSGVAYLATQRNKELLKQYDRLQATRDNIQSYVDKVTELTGTDQENTRKALMDAFNMQSNILQLSSSLQKTQVEQYAAARDFALQNNISKPFYSIGGTVYSTASGLPARNIQEYIDMGGNGSFSDVQQVKSVGQLQKFTTVNGTDAFWDPVTGQVYDPSGLTPAQTGVQVGSLFGLPAYDTQASNPGMNRPTRNNNPGNIKASDATVAYPGVVGVEATPAADGGNFLVFASPQAGLDAIGYLLQNGSSYKNVSAETAIRKYSGGGYGAADVGLDPNTSFQQQISDPAVLKNLVNSIAVREGYNPGTTQMSDSKYIAQAIENGNQPPSLTGLYGKSAAVRAQLEKDGFDLYQATQDYQAAQRWITTMNSAQMLKYRALADSVVNTIGEVNNLAGELNLNGITALNKAELEAYRNLNGNSPKGQLVSQYLAAVNTLKEEFANLAQGGYAPTEAAWGLANQQINANYGVKQLNASLTEVQRLINYRLQGLNSQAPVTPGSVNTSDATGYLNSIGVGSSSSPADNYLDTLNLPY